jgi:elongation factor G
VTSWASAEPPGREDSTYAHYRDPVHQRARHPGQGTCSWTFCSSAWPASTRSRWRPHPKSPTRDHQGHGRGAGQAQEQTGGHGQFGDVRLRLKPNERGAGYDFVEHVVGGVVPKQYIHHVTRHNEALQQGVITQPRGGQHCGAVLRLVPTRGLLRNGVQDRGRKAIQKAVKEEKPCLLEPIKESRSPSPRVHG